MVSDSQHVLPNTVMAKPTGLSSKRAGVCVGERVWEEREKLMGEEELDGDSNSTDSGALNSSRRPKNHVWDVGRDLLLCQYVLEEGAITTAHGEKMSAWTRVYDKLKCGGDTRDPKICAMFSNLKNGQACHSRYYESYRNEMRSTV